MIKEQLWTTQLRQIFNNVRVRVAKIYNFAFAQGPSMKIAQSLLHLEGIEK